MQNNSLIIIILFLLLLLQIEHTKNNDSPTIYFKDMITVRNNSNLRSSEIFQKVKVKLLNRINN